MTDLEHDSETNAVSGLAPAALVDIGNSSTDVALWLDDAISIRETFEPENVAGAVTFMESFRRQNSELLSAVVVASVVPKTFEALRALVGDRLLLAAMQVGRQVPWPIPVEIPHPEKVGADRICAAAAAFEAKKEPCIIVDIGSAITIDLVDGEGAFVGGAILPGLRMQTQALHHFTALLPDVDLAPPRERIGADTQEAIRVGVHYGTAGAIRNVVEVFSERIGRWPPVVATGGGAALLADSCGIFEIIVPDLCLRGIGLAYQRWLAGAVPL